MSSANAYLLVWAFRLFSLFWVFCSAASFSCLASSGYGKPTKGKDWIFGSIPMPIRDFTDILCLASMSCLIHFGLGGSIVLGSAILGFTYQKVQCCTFVGKAKVQPCLRRSWILLLLSRAVIFVLAVDFFFYSSFRMLGDLLAL